MFKDSLMANGQAFFPFFAAFTIWISRYKYKGSAGTNRRGQQVQIQRSAGTNTRVSRYKYKGQQVEIQGSAGTNTRVSRYKYKAQQVQIQGSAGTNTRVSRYKYRSQQVQIQGSAGTNTMGIKCIWIFKFFVFCSLILC